MPSGISMVRLLVRLDNGSLAIMGELVDGDTFSLDLPVFVICDESLAKKEGAFPIAGGVTDHDEKVVYIFSDSDLARRCLDDNKKNAPESSVVSHVDDPFHVIAILEIAIEKDYRFVAIDPATERESTPRVFPIERIVSEFKRAIHDQA